MRIPLPHKTLFLASVLAAALMAIGLSQVAMAQTFKFRTIYNYQNDGSDLGSPQGNILVDGHGNIYAAGGGDFSHSGMIYEVSRNGKLVSLFNFPGGQSEGDNSPLTRDKAGNLYGLVTCEVSSICVFKVTPSGEETILHQFLDDAPIGPLTIDPAGNLYGVGSTGSHGMGMIYKVSADGTYSDLYDFCSLPDCADGSEPVGRLVLDSAGNLYGTNANGVQNIFKLTPDGVETVVYDFHLSGTSTGPHYLIQDNLDNLYGLTAYGGTNFGGSLFTLPEAGGTFTTLYNFCSQANCRDGQSPLGVVRDSKGNLYGTTNSASPGTGGLIWEYTAGGQERTLYAFPRGVFLYIGLAIDPSGNLYGATGTGGTGGLGSLFLLKREH